MTRAEQDTPGLRWFRAYVQELENAAAVEYAAWRGCWLCPCCHCPTLTTRREFEICWLCNWEDDGQDNHNADKILGGPNADYSLTEARQNFARYCTMYRPADTRAFERSTVKKGFGGVIRRDLVVIKKQLVEKYGQARATTDPVVTARLLAEIAQLKTLLR